MSITYAYAPKLICAGIIFASLEDTCASVRNQLVRIIGENNFISEGGAVEWMEFFENDGVFYDGKRFKIALFSPRADHTVYVCNLSDGWISLYENIVAAGAIDAYFFRSTLLKSAEYKIFEMLSWRRGILQRQLRVLQDDNGWDFLNNGSLLPFEEVERYKNRRVKDRLDNELIDRYSEAAGYRISSVTSFNGRCCRFWRSR